MPRRPAKAAIPAAIPGLAARRAALRLLDAVLRRGEPLELAFHAAAQGIADRADRALVHAIAAGALRYLADLDALIDSATRQPLPDDAKARTVLRIALVQALLLKTPAHAVIATALPLVDGGPRRLVHGVLGTLLRSEAELPDAPNLPVEVEARWRDAWGEPMVEEARRAIAAPPPTDLTVRHPSETERWAEALGGISLAPGHIRLPAERAGIDTLPGYAEGAWWVQDLAASLPARLLGAGEDENGARTVLDLCAAPGGKTMQLAAAGWCVTAVDQSRRRMERLSENLARTGLTAEPAVADLRDWQPPEPVDAILLDAPCTATGIFRRHPDVLHRIGAPQIAELAELQAALLRRAADWLRPGGTLIYAVCSLEPAEGEAQAKRLLADRPDFAPLGVDGAELPAGLQPNRNGWIRTLPGSLAESGSLDGFFVARFRRR